jgi:uncharacterized protein (TIGR00266 family)
MQHEIRHRPSDALLVLELGPGEQVVAEAGALVSHGDGIRIETGARGGLFGSLKRLFGGESFFVNTFHADDATTLSLAPPLPGDIVALDVAGEELFVQSGAYLAAGDGVEVDTEFGGARTFLGGEGLFLLRVSGQGPLFINSYGALEEIELAAGERLTVDTGHVAAFRDTAFDVRRVGGLKSTLFSGEGLVCEFDGPGTVWLQSRSLDALLSWLDSHLTRPAVYNDAGREFSDNRPDGGFVAGGSSAPGFRVKF